MANQLDALSVPDVGDECVARRKSSFEIARSETSVVDLAAQSLFDLADFGCELRLVRPADNQNVNIAGPVGLVFRKRSVNPGGFDPGNPLECALQRWFNTNRALQ
ncbi:MAG: hypothetical protein WCB02_13750 [Bradyrhizobium sp.]